MRTFLPKLLLLSLSISVSKISISQSIQKKIDTKIEKVTVFLNGAQINRTGKTIINPGNSIIIFSGISPYINSQSIQVNAEGNFTILSVVHKLNYLQEQARQADIKTIDDQKELIQDKINMEQNMMSIYQNEETLLSKNQGIVAQNTGLKMSDLKAAADFHRSRLMDLKQKETEVNKTLKKLNAEMVKLNKQHDELYKQATTATSEVFVTVQSKEIVNANLNLTYFVDKAGWYPTYDIRVKDVMHPITMAYKANVYQSSGEDWNNVKLTLSTANPQQNGDKPELFIWHLRYFTAQNLSLAGKISGVITNSGIINGRIYDETGHPVSFATVKLKGLPTGVSADINGYFRITVPINTNTISISAVGYENREVFVSSNFMDIVLEKNNADLQEVVVTSAYQTKKSVRKNAQSYSQQTVPLAISENENSTSFSFDIETPYTILNDGKTGIVEIKTMEIQALYEYFCVPKLDQDAFLTAKITDWNDLNLLQGESNLFFEGTYLGKAMIDPKTSGDTLNISLGRDKNISVKRNRIKEYSKKQFLGNNKIDYRTFEISIRNNKKQSINLVVEDQFPVSTMKEVEVEKIEYKEAELNNETGNLKWIIQLDAGKEKKVSFKYTVKYPKNNNIVLE
ncbi:MAG TPA: DUF4139 domain-containing protein [Ferruginibacter sp.]|nr:DUF4139 domain-containing protein [Ferruginibacter sp.]